MRALCLAAVLAIPCGSALADFHSRAGDVLATAMPVAALGGALLAGDKEGAWQFTETLVASLVVTQALKKTVHERRPDGKDTEAFASGHATRAFAPAAYWHRRYGLETAWPAYVAATYVGYTRVRSDHHYWHNIAISAGLSVGIAYWRVQPLGRDVAIGPRLDGNGVGVQLSARW